MSTFEEELTSFLATQSLFLEFQSLNCCSSRKLEQQIDESWNAAYQKYQIATKDLSDEDALPFEQKAKATLEEHEQKDREEWRNKREIQFLISQKLAVIIRNRFPLVFYYQELRIRENIFEKIPHQPWNKKTLTRAIYKKIWRELIKEGAQKYNLIRVKAKGFHNYDPHYIFIQGNIMSGIHNFEYGIAYPEECEDFFYSIGISSCSLLINVHNF